MRKTQYTGSEKNQPEKRGNIYYRVTCPVCFRSFTIEHFRNLIKSIPDDQPYFVIQAREQHPREVGGTSAGFTLVPELSLTLEEASSIPGYFDVIEFLQKRIRIAGAMFERIVKAKAKKI
jgi:C4-type Zn-finger protein